MASASRSDSWNARSSSGFVATKCSVRRRRRFVLAVSAMFASVPFRRCAAPEAALRAPAAARPDFRLTTPKGCAALDASRCAAAVTCRV
uniref:Uncharacterized protein n=1 Tax=Pelagomonas calceolata TaxID=35677 RepID=A0A7S4A6X4_9STRA